MFSQSVSACMGSRSNFNTKDATRGSWPYYFGTLTEDPMTRFDCPTSVYGRSFLRTCMSFYNHIMVPQKCQANTQPGNDQPGPWTHKTWHSDKVVCTCLGDIKSDAMTANLSCIVGCVGGLLAAFLWVMMARACPGPVVYISCPEGKKYKFWGDMWGDLTSILGFK